ncbi:MAG: radical SAM family heme chaperone HemW [Acholeplasmataceae bacterium]|nr:radical SAM family heme chaperone HemW [Acholeplasmataceae bacterium]
MHIPFCESICHYCDFVKRIPKNQEMIESYLSSLIEEITSFSHHFSQIETIYIGGGTPSMLSESQMIRLFEALKDIHPIEYTIEVNPESYTKEKGNLFKKYSINRVSLGVQTFDYNLLVYLNRKHTEDMVFDVVSHLKSLPIERISVDLIYAIPGQTMEMLAVDLQKIKALDITHVSCYSLILEEKTYFYHQYLKGEFHQMDEDLEATMYAYVMHALKDQGFEHYEISNYAKHGHYSMHNLLYWTLGEYLGVGLGAHGFVDGYRTFNHRHLNDYQKQFLDHKEKQTEEMLLQDELIFGLRKIQGVDIKLIEDKYQVKLMDKYPKLKEKITYGLVEIKQGKLRLTEKGVFLGNQVFMVFI